jgi:hypothetical protein
MITKTYYGIVSLALMIIATFGARQLLPIINPITILTREADRKAYEWVSLNIQEGSTFMINPFLWGFGLYAGNDGGYWISPMTGFLTIPPPALYGLGDAGTVGIINSLSSQTYDSGSDPQSIWELMTSNNLDYIFIGARGGPLSPHALSQSSIFDEIYNDDGVYIFEPVILP